MGPRYLLQGFGFSAGFFVILSGSILFTEANVVLPSTLLGKLVKFWALALVGNFIGAIVTSWLISRAQVYPPEMQEALEAFVATMGRSIIGKYIPVGIGNMIGGAFLVAVPLTPPSSLRPPAAVLISSCFSQAVATCPNPNLL